MLEPLKPGTHELKFSASQLGAGTTGENTVLDVKYNLNVKQLFTSDEVHY